MSLILDVLAVLAHLHFPQCKLKHGCCILQFRELTFKIGNFSLNSIDDTLVVSVVYVKQSGSCS